MPSQPEMHPTLIYDGDCGICKRWVTYWAGLTGVQVVYRTYQDAANDYPGIPLESFRRAIQFVEPDDHVYSGAAATFRVLRHAPGRRIWWWLYAHVPGFAPAAEWTYRFFAQRRGLLNQVTRLLWGTALEPEQYDLVRWVFLRGLGLIYFAAFASLSAQILGLVGVDGVLPLESFLRMAREQVGVRAYGLVPTLFWLNASDTALVAGTVAGMALALLATLGIAARVGVGRAVRTLPLVCLRRARLHDVSVGPAAARSRVPGDLPHRRLAHRGLAVSLAGFSVRVHGRRGEAAFRRSDVAQPHRTGLPLRDAAAADGARVVRSALAALDAGGGDCRHACRRSRRRLSHFCAAPPARGGGLVRPRLPEL